MESGPSKTAAQRRFCWVRPDCLHWEVKQETYLEVRNAQHRWQGQNRELFNNLPLIGEVPHCSTFITPKKWEPKERHTDTKEAKKVVWGRGGAGNLKKTTTNTSLDAEFSPIVYLAFPSFHRAPYHWTTIIPSYGFPNRTMYTVPSQGSQ
jgi:hypothetical protein